MRRAPGGWLCTVALLAVACNGGGGGAAPAPAPEERYKQVLADLGLANLLASPPPATVTDSAGVTHTVDPARWQPLKKDVTVFGPRGALLEVGANVTQAGVTGHSAYWGDRLDDWKASTPLAAEPGFSGARTVVAADIDGDGIDEAVLLYVKSKDDPAVYSRIGTCAASGACTFSNEAPIAGLAHGAKSLERYTGSSPGLGTLWFPYFSASKADLDGTGRASILLVDYDTLYLLPASRDAAGHWTLTSDLVNGKVTYSGPVSSVAAGDLDGDRKDELIVAYWDPALFSGCPAWVMYRAGLQPMPDHAWPLPVFVFSGPMEVTTGDFEGTGIEDVVLAGNDNAGNALGAIFRFDEALPAPLSGPLAIATASAASANVLGQTFLGSSGFFRYLPRAVDLMGTGQASLELMGALFYRPLVVDQARKSYPDKTLADYNPWVGSAGCIPGTLCIGEPSIVDIQVGNLMSAGTLDPIRESLVVLIGCSGCQNMPEFPITHPIYGELFAVGLAANDVLTTHGFPIVPPNDVFMSGVALAAGHFEDNSPRVQYVRHDLTYTDPMVIAALAAAPYWQDVAAADTGYSAAFPNWSTTMGRTTEDASGSGHTVGFYAGFQINYEGKLDLFGVKVANFQASFAFRQSNAWQWFHQESVASEVQYVCQGGYDDQVVFSTIPTDRYLYTILTSPTAEEVGKTVSINIPRQPTIKKVPRAQYNAAVSGLMPPIDASVFAHTIGNPRSYPTRAVKDQLLNTTLAPLGANVAHYQNGPHSLPSGTAGLPDPGPIPISLGFSAEDGLTITHDFSVDLAAGGGAGGFTKLATAGFNYGYSTNSSTRSTTMYGGTVGYLPASFDDAKHGVSLGLFVYPYTDADKRQFWVVDYWWE